MLSTTTAVWDDGLTWACEQDGGRLELNEHVRLRPDRVGPTTEGRTMPTRRNPHHVEWSILPRGMVDSTSDMRFAWETNEQRNNRFESSWPVIIAVRKSFSNIRTTVLRRHNLYSLS